MDILLKTRLQAKKLLSGAGIYCGDGWFDLISLVANLITSDCLRTGNRKTRIIEAKEKLGSLTIHASGGSEYAAGVRLMANALSHYICETCGSLDGELGRCGPVMTRCPAHREPGWQMLGVRHAPACDVPEMPIIGRAFATLLARQKANFSGAIYTPGATPRFSISVAGEDAAHWSAVAVGAADLADVFLNHKLRENKY